MFTLLGSGLYIGLGLAGVGLVGIEALRHLGTTVGATLFNSLNSFTLSAVPMFLLLAQIILRSGLSARLYNGISKWTRIIPGGLLHSNILACSIFAAVSGSSVATAATIGTVAYPEQKKRGYDSKIVTGSLAAGGTLGPLIPPSILMIIYGAYVNESVGKLFAGGIVPGITLALMFMIYIGLATIKNKSLGPPPEKVTKSYFREAVIAFKDIWPVLLIIVTIMGSIYGGIMTPTEAAAVSTFMALLLGTAFGKMSFATLKDAAIETIRTCSMVYLLYIGAVLLGTALGLLRIPAQLANLVTNFGLSPMWIWFVVIILYLILGCFMESLAMMLITLPVTYPLVVDLAGFSPVWFGVQLVVLAEIGMVTPPVGMNLFIIHGIAKDVDIGTIVRGVIPFFVCMLIGLAIFTYAPDLVLFLPSNMLGN